MPTNKINLEQILKNWVASFDKSYNTISTFGESNPTTIEEINNHEKKLDEKLLRTISDNLVYLGVYVKEAFEQTKKENGDKIYYQPKDLDAPYVKDKIKYSKEEFNKIKSFVEPKKENGPKEELNYGIINGPIDFDKFEKVVNKPIKNREFKYVNSAFCRIGVNEIARLRLENSPPGIKSNFGELQNDSLGLSEKANEYVDILGFKDIVHSEMDDARKELETLGGYASQYDKYLRERKELPLGEVDETLNKFVDFKPMDDFGQRLLESQTRYRAYLDDLDDIDDLIEIATAENDTSFIESLNQEKTTVQNNINKEMENFISFNNGFSDLKKYNNKNEKIGNALLDEADLEYLLYKKERLSNKLDKIRAESDAYKGDIESEDFRIRFVVPNENTVNEYRQIDEKIKKAKAKAAVNEKILKEFNSRNFRNDEFARAYKTNSLLDHKAKEIEPYEIMYNEYNQRYNEAVERNASQADLEILRKARTIAHRRFDIKYESHTNQTQNLNNQLTDVKKSIPGFYETSTEMAKFASILENRFKALNTFASAKENDTQYLKIFNKKYAPYKENLKKIRDVENYVSNYNNIVLSDAEINQIIDSNNFVLNPETSERLKTSLSSFVENEPNKFILKDFIGEIDAFKNEMVNSVEAEVFLDELKYTKASYDNGLEVCKTNISPSEMTGAKLSGLIDKIIKHRDNFDLEYKNDLKPFAKDDNSNRLATCVGLLHGMTRLADSLPQPSTYNKVDKSNYLDMYQKFQSLKNSFSSSLEKGVKSNDGERLNIIKNLINDKKTRNSDVFYSQIDALYESLLDNNNRPRRESKIDAEKKKRSDAITKVYNEKLCRGYQVAKTDPKKFLDDCFKDIGKMFEMSANNSSYAKRFASGKASIERLKCMEDYSKKYYKHENLSFFKKWFDSKGVKERDEARTNLQRRFGFSDVMCDVVKYGPQISEKQLISVMKNGTSVADQDMFEHVILSHHWLSDKKVMNAYTNFCKKIGRNPDYSYTPEQKAVQEVKKEEKVVNNNEQIKENNVIANEKQEEINKDVNKKNVILNEIVDENKQQIQKPIIGNVSENKKVIVNEEDSFIIKKS